MCAYAGAFSVCHSFLDCMCVCVHACVCDVQVCACGDLQMSANPLLIE